MIKFSHACVFWDVIANACKSYRIRLMTMQLTYDARCRLNNHVIQILSFQDLLNFHASLTGTFEAKIAWRSFRVPMDFADNHKEGCLTMKFLMRRLGA